MVDRYFWTHWQHVLHDVYLQTELFRHDMPALVRNFFIQTTRGSVISYSGRDLDQSSSISLPQSTATVLQIRVETRFPLSSSIETSCMQDALVQTCLMKRSIYLPRWYVKIKKHID